MLDMHGAGGWAKDHRRMGGIQDYMSEGRLGLRDLRVRGLGIGAAFCICGAVCALL